MNQHGFIDSVYHLIKAIADPIEQEIAAKLIFHKTEQHHKVKYVPFHEDWGIDPSFAPVKDALIKLTTIKFALASFKAQLQSTSALRVTMYIDRVYQDLFKCLIVHGCSAAPDYILRRYIARQGVTVSALEKSECIELAREICEHVLKNLA